MRVLQISSGAVRIPPDRAGGIEGHIMVMSKCLADMGHDVTIIDRKYGTNDPSFETVRNVHIVRIFARRSGSTIIRRIGQFIREVQEARIFLFDKTAFLFKVYGYLGETANTYDYVFVYELFIAFFLGMIDRRLREKLIYTHTSSKWPSDHGFKNRLLSFLGAFVSRRVRLVVVQNDLIRSYFMTYVKMPTSHVALIPPGVDLDLFGDNVCRHRRQLVHKKTVLFSGRITPQKGIENIVKSANIVVKKFGLRNVEFFLVGPWEQFGITEPSAYVQKIRCLIKSLGLEENVKLTGFIPLMNLREIMMMSDIFVYPSLSESFGQAMTEAMACGKPIVATRTPGAVMQIKDGWNGFLVDVDDEEQLADRIMFLLQNPMKAIIMGNNGKMFAKEYDWRRITARYVKCLEDLDRGVLS